MRKSRAKAERGKRMANHRWEMDRERREMLAAQELERQRRLVVILRDNQTGEERAIPYRDFSPGWVYGMARREW
jgi:hypothetical protein